MKSPTEVQENQENPFLNILFNIILPVVILNKLGKHLGPHGATWALLVALSFPLFYGAYDYIKRKKKNYVSLLGLINVLLTGGLALLKLEGIWFAIKEAAFPLVIGVGVYLSRWTKNPAMKLLIDQAQLIRVEKVHEKLRENQAEEIFFRHLQKSTVLFSLSFFLSALLNFILARWVFVDIDPQLSEVQRTTLLNEQIAKMTWLSFIVIVLPLMIFMGFILWHLFSGIKKLTHLDLEEILAHPPKTKS